MTSTLNNKSNLENFKIKLKRSFKANKHNGSKGEIKVDKLKNLFTNYTDENFI